MGNLGGMDFEFEDGSLVSQQTDLMGVVRRTIGNRETFWDVERDFVKDPWVAWMGQRWRDSFVYGVIYVIVVFGGQQIMKNREKFELRGCLTLWNLSLAVFSIFGAIRCISELVEVIHTKGWKASILDNGFYDGSTGFWVMLFSFSKLVELGDTAFIVLRKQPLIFLHWYHHMTTLCYGWQSYSEQTATGRWFVAMNFFVHSLMYSYYAIRAMKFRPPRWVMISITSLQILQMLIGCSIGFYILNLKLHGEQVNQSWRNLSYCFIVYISYFVLFSHFFYTTYYANKNKMSVEKKEKAK